MQCRAAPQSRPAYRRYMHQESNEGPGTEIGNAGDRILSDLVADKAVVTILSCF